MKKFFTLIAAVAMAASMNAQGTYAVAEGDKVTAGDQITSVNNVTLTYCENAGTAFAVGKATDNWVMQTLQLMFVVRATVSWCQMQRQLVVFISSKQ